MYKLYKRPNSPYWCYDFSINGTRFRNSTKRTNKREADAVAARIFKEESDSYQLGKKKRISVGELFARYYQEIGQHMPSEDTVYSRLIAFQEYFGKDRFWDTIADNDLAKYVAKRRTEYTKKVKNFKDGRKEVSFTNRLVKPSTINKEIGLLRTINNLCQNTWKIYKLAIFDVKKHLLEESEGRKAFFSDDDTQKIIDALPKPHCWCFELAILTGVRASNAKRLKREQIHRYKDDPFIEFWIKSVKKVSGDENSGKYHTVPITKQIESLFQKMEKSGVDFSGKGHLFVYESGQHQGKPLGDIRKALYSAYEKAGYDRKLGEGMHLTRHTAGTRLAKIDLGLTQELLGHSNFRTTKVYTHNINQILKQAMESIGGSEVTQN